LLCIQDAFTQRKGYRNFLPTHKAINYMGRVDFSNPLRPSFWQPGVSIDCVFKGDSCGVIVEDEIKWGTHHNYIEVVLDNKATRLKLSSKRDTIWAVATSKKNWHTLLVCKNTEANIGGLSFVGLLCKNLRVSKTAIVNAIECIGNSITSGTGSDQSDVPCGKGSWYDQHNAYKSYGMVLARKLNAQVHLSSVSGIGLMHSCCNLPVIMPTVFDKINMSENKISWNFARYQPSIVTICLGQNDGMQDSAIFVRSYVRFLQDLRKVYPAANFICLSSPMADANLKAFMVKTIKSVVTALTSAGDHKVSSYFFQKSYNAGCDGHPSLEEHEAIATELEIYLRKNFFSL
jgi:hypothetical protein